MTFVKKVGTSIVNAFAGCLVPVIPVLIGAALFKAVLALSGPDVLGWISADSDLYFVFDFVADTGFYFLPVYVGYSAARYFDTSRMLGLFIGALLLHPNLVSVYEAGQTLRVYGIPASVQSYSSTILPALLSVWILKYVLQGMERIVPEAIASVFVPFLTMLVMVPVVLCVIGPLGSWLGSGLVAAVLWIGSFSTPGRILCLVIVGAFWQYIVMVGMHWLFITAIVQMTATGNPDGLIFPAVIASSFSIGGMCLGAFFKMKNARARADAMGDVIAQTIGGVTEPGLYGVGFQYARPMLGMILGGAAGGLYAGITGVQCLNLVPVANFLIFLGYTGKSPANLVHAVITAIIGFSVAAIVSWIVTPTNAKAVTENETQTNGQVSAGDAS